MNILEYINWLVEECGWSEESAEMMADIEFNLEYESEDD